MVPIKRQRRRGLHTVHQIRLRQFYKSILRQSTVTDSIGQTISDTPRKLSKVNASGNFLSVLFISVVIVVVFQLATFSRTRATSRSGSVDRLYRWV